MPTDRDNTASTASSALASPATGSSAAATTATDWLATTQINQVPFADPSTGRAVRPRTTPFRAMGDKAYSSKANRKMLRDRGIHAVIPERSDEVANRKQRGQVGGRPPTFDKLSYKRRNVIERCFEVFKQWRGVATRYDKLALTYRGGVVLRAIIIWAKALGDTP